MSSVEGELREHIFYTGVGLVQDHAPIVDLSPGNSLFIETFIQAGEDDQKFILCDAPRAVRKRYKDDQRVIDHDSVTPLSCPPEQASLTLCMFALANLSLGDRDQVFRDVYQHTVPGGGFILVESVASHTNSVDNLLKHASLSMGRYVQRPGPTYLPATWYVDMLREAGFYEVECFYRSFHVAAWVAIRGEK